MTLQVRAATVVRGALGLAVVAQPGAVLAAIGSPDRDEPATRLAARVLGGRLLLQAAVDVAVGRRTRWPGAVVELTHAASMAPLAARASRHRRSATFSAACALLLAVLDVSDLHLGQRRTGVG